MLALCTAGALFAGEAGWYTQGDFEPRQRIVVTVSNPLAAEGTEASGV